MARTNYQLDITAHDKTSKAFASVGRNLKKMRSSVNQTVGRVAKIGSAFAVAGAGATAAMVKMRMTAIDNLAKTADKLGVTTEALRGLQMAAEITGVKTKTMNMALQRMTRRVAEAAMGTGEAKGALQELGLVAADLQRLPLEQQMEKIAEAMGGVEMQSDKVRLAMKLFDSEGVSLVNTLALGEEGLQRMAREAEQLGLSVSRVEAAQIEAANDAMTRARGVSEGFFNQLTVALSPAVTELAANFYQGALDANEMGNVGQAAAQKLFRGFGFVADAVLGIRLAINGIQLVFAEFVQLFLQGVSKIGSVIDFLIDKYNKVAEVLRLDTIDLDVSENVAMLAESFGDQADNIREKIADALNSPLPSERIMEWFDGVQMKARETAEVVAANAPSAVLTETAEEGAKKMSSLTRESQAAALTQVDTIVSTTQSQMDALSGVFKEGSAASKAFFVASQALAAGMAIVNGLQAATAIRTAYAQLAAITANPALLGIGEAHANAATAMGFATAGMIAGQTIASFEGGGFTGLGARVGGLDGKGGMLAVLHPNEKVTDMEKGGSSQPVNISFNIQANDAQGFDELLARRRGMIVSMVNRAMNERGKRGVAQ